MFTYLITFARVKQNVINKYHMRLKDLFKDRFCFLTDKALGNLGTKTGSAPAINASLNVRSYPRTLGTSIERKGLREPARCV